MLTTKTSLAGNLSCRKTEQNHSELSEPFTNNGHDVSN